ncbi:glycoside hydrolase family 13 protein [Treponema sp. OMZ 803]|uniref:glycoside hydrolase family 13 protein n=1 Tax=Treponema sp. OMZ 803 TaxID=120682 RepID=UPI0020A4CB6B|nr:glycoside hydrolase family 13 protein [Treponema sp. OMZ 803]UTC54071.1 glycoside hydrolase family 13 protein [Treponema sp. OMZ 803]
MQFSAIEHRSTDNFCYPLNENELMISLKTGSDIRRVFIVYGDPFDGSVTPDGWAWEGKRQEITRKKDLPYHTWWQVTVMLLYGRCKYCFELHGQDEGDVRYCLENGFYTADELVTLRRITGNFPGFEFPWLDGAECVRVPDWVPHTVWYQIFPDRFCRDTASQKPNALPWPAAEDAVTNNEHYGGTLRGITEKLGYLADLNITGLYLNPVNVSPSVHKYDTSDYLNIDPAFGSADDLHTLVKEAHARGIKVMLDGVFNHCGWDFALWQDVVRNGKASPYFDWFIVQEWPFETVAEPECENAASRSRPSGTNGKSGRYSVFAYVDTMPKLNTNNPAVVDYLLNVCETWVRSYDIDGLRLDVANELSHTFCRQLYRRMRSLKKDFYLLGEIWRSALPWLRGGELDSVMNYPLALCFWKFFCDKTLSALTFEREINAVFTAYPEPVTVGLFNLLDSHDTPRLFTRNDGDVSAVWQQYALLLSLPGSPCIYYGSEVLLAGGNDPDCRRCMPWQAIEAGEYAEPMSMMRQLIALRHTHPAMTASGYSYLHDVPLAESEPNRIIHLQKYTETVEPAETTETVETAGVSSTRSIDLILNCGTAPVSIAQIIDEKARVYLSLRCRDKTVQPGGFIFFEHLINR